MSPGLIVLAVVLLFLITLLFIPIGVGAKYENGTFVIVKLAVFSFDIPINKITCTSVSKINTAVVWMNSNMNIVS